MRTLRLLYIVFILNSQALYAGGSWGTEGSRCSPVSAESLDDLLFRQQEEISDLYKIKLSGVERLGQLVKIKESGTGRSVGESRLFENSEARLFSKVHICYDKNLNLNTSELNHKIRYFEDLLNGSSLDNQSMQKAERKIEFRQFVIEHSKISESGCHIFFTRGSWQSYPFSRLQSTSYYSSKFDDVLKRDTFFALNIRLANDLMPVVSIHPDIVLRTNDVFTHYFRYEKNHLSIDAGTLILHELGHLLGFAHISDGTAYSAEPALSVMGLDSLQLIPQAEYPTYNRCTESRMARLSQAQNVWRHWDLRQISIYKSALWGESRSGSVICLNRDEELYLPLSKLKKTNHSLPLVPFKLGARLSLLEAGLPRTPLYDQHTDFFKLSDKLLIFTGVLRNQNYFKLLNIEFEDLDDQWRPVLHVRVAPANPEQIAALPFAVSTAGTVEIDDQAAHNIRAAIRFMKLIYAPTAQQCPEAIQTWFSR